MTNQTSSPRKKALPPRRCFQFGLNLLLMAMLVFGCGLSWLISKRMESQKQWNCIHRIQASGGVVHFANSNTANGWWVQQCLGIALPGKVIAINIGSVDSIERVINDISQHNEVEELSFGFLSLSDDEEESLMPLQKLPKLKRVTLTSPNLLGAEIQHLCKSSSLEELNLFVADSLPVVSFELDESLFAGISKSPRLRTLHFSTLASIGENDLQPLTGSNTIEELHIQCPSLSDSALSALSRLPRLKSLELPISQIHGIGLKRLVSSSPLLERLVVSHAPLDSAGMEVIENCVTIKTLDIQYTPAKDEWFENAIKLRNLQYLNLSGTCIADDITSNLVNNKAIERLDLNDTAISDSGVFALAMFSNIKRIELENTAVTEVSLAYFHDLSSLQVLVVPRSLDGTAGIEALKAARPKLNILYD